MTKPTLKNSSIKTTTAAAVTLLALLSSACHTMEGVGKDLESAGDKAEEVTKS